MAEQARSSVDTLLSCLTAAVGSVKLARSASMDTKPRFSRAFVNSAFNLALCLSTESLRVWDAGAAIPRLFRIRSWTSRSARLGDSYMRFPH